MALNKSHVIARLETARDFIATHGWHRGSLINIGDDGKVSSCCALGALTAVDPALETYKVVDDELDERWSWNGSGNRPLIRECEQALNDTAIRRCGDGIIGYNDDIASGKRDIIRVYNATIKRLQAS